jgi:rubrerythrin
MKTFRRRYGSGGSFRHLKIAIVHEYEAYEFYNKAAAGTSNAEAKALFERFAASEFAHKTALEELYKTLRK